MPSCAPTVPTPLNFLSSSNNHNYDIFMHFPHPFTYLTGHTYLRADTIQYDVAKQPSKSKGKSTRNFMGFANRPMMISDHTIPLSTQEIIYTSGRNIIYSNTIIRILCAESQPVPVYVHCIHAVGI